MSEQDYKAGLGGAEWSPGMNREDYEAGVSKRNFGKTIFSDWPKVEVPGVAYTLIIASPLLPFVYPVLGVAVNGTFIGMALVASRLPGIGTWVLLIGFLAGVVAFFPGLWLEAQASQATLYRMARTTWRLLAPVGVAILAHVDETGFHFRPNASGQTVGSGVFIGLVVHFVCSLLDRLYFPVKAQVLKQREQLAKGIRPTRPLMKRMIYGLLWVIPIVLLINVAVMIGVRSVTGDYSVYEAFRASYATIINAAGAAVWYLLCLLGILPGTGKHPRMLVDPNLVDV